ncbi:MAG: hypothetical protein ABUT20_03920 [Bacteroidota bacterium]
MKRFTISFVLVFLTLSAFSQNHQYWSVATFNTQTDYPFGKFAGMFSKVYHPGIEVTLGKNFSVKQKHDWFWDIRAAYFYHRFVQHGIPLYANIGYRYKAGIRFSSDISIGAGYMQSIPATAKLKLDADGDYKTNKGIGRSQAIAALSISAGYSLHPFSERPTKLFIAYQQRLQMPFVRSYVPLLPYNSFMIGVSRSLRKK